MMCQHCYKVELREDDTLLQRKNLDPDDIVRSQAFVSSICISSPGGVLPADSLCSNGVPGLPDSLPLQEDYVEQEELAMAKPPPRLQKHYMDNTCTVMNKAQAQEFTDYLNSVDADIKWLTEGQITSEKMVMKSQ